MIVGLCEFIKVCGKKSIKYHKVKNIRPVYWVTVDISDVVFQHDNDPKHTSKATKEYLMNQELEILPWPAQSPDLNPIEHLWHYLKVKIGSYENRPTSIHSLWQYVDEKWNKISVEVCQKLIETMPKRIQAVIEAKGGHTKY